MYEGTAGWNLFPTDRGRLEMELLDRLTRLSDRMRGTSRWLTAPRFRLFENRVSCPGTFYPDESCPAWVATEHLISSQQRALWLNAIASASQLVGDMTPTFEFARYPPGSRIPSEDLFGDGIFAVGEYVERGMAGTTRPRAFGEEIRSVLLLVGVGFGFTQDFYVRTVATGLGFATWISHPDGMCEDLLGRGKKTIFCMGHGLTAPTDVDHAMGRALYSRPIGHRYPDRDPLSR